MPKKTRNCQGPPLQPEQPKRVEPVASNTGVLVVSSSRIIGADAHESRASARVTRRFSPKGQDQREWKRRSSWSPTPGAL